MFYTVAPTNPLCSMGKPSSQKTSKQIKKHRLRIIFVALGQLCLFDDILNPKILQKIPKVRKQTLPLFKAGQLVQHWVASSSFWAPPGRLISCQWDQRGAQWLFFSPKLGYLFVFILGKVALFVTHPPYDTTSPK